MDELETLITELDNKQQTRARENNGEVEVATTPDIDKVYEHEDEIRLQWPMDVEDEFNDVADVEDMEDVEDEFDVDADVEDAEDEINVYVGAKHD